MSDKIEIKLGDSNPMKSKKGIVAMRPDGLDTIFIDEEGKEKSVEEFTKETVELNKELPEVDDGEDSNSN